MNTRLHGGQLFPTEMRSALSDRGKTVFQRVGRLMPAIALAQAQANTAIIATDLARAFPATNEDRAATMRPIREVLFTSSFGESTPVLAASAGLLTVVESFC